MVIELNKVSVAVPTVREAEGETRDPHEINRNLDVSWSSVVAEPEGLRSPDAVWKISAVCFSIVQALTYKLLALILAPIFALIIGFHMALAAFVQVWCLRPCHKFCSVLTYMCRQFVELAFGALCGPAFEIVGLVFSRVKIRHQRVVDTKDEPQFPFII